MRDERKDVRIMVLDDEPLIAMTTEQVIRDMGYDHVDVFCRLDEAEEALKEQTYDLAILDVNVGRDSTSLELARAMKKAGTAIVFATGDSGDDEALTSLSSTIVGKPFGEAAIEQVLEDALAIRKG